MIIAVVINVIPIIFKQLQINPQKISENCNYHCGDHIFIYNLYFRNSHHLQNVHAFAGIQFLKILHGACP